MPADPRILGYLLTDAAMHYYYDTTAGLWIALGYTDETTGEQVSDFLPPPAAFLPDAAPARKAAQTLQEQGIDARPTRVRVPC
jgi:hypothetical protein